MGFINVRMPPVLEMVLDPETDEGVYLDDWEILDKSLNSILDSAYVMDFSSRCISSILRCILSPDPREREKSFEIAWCLMDRSLLERSFLVNILVEYLTDEIGHYGVDLILKLLNSSGDILPEEVSEIYVPLLTKPLNIKIRREIIIGITNVYTYSTLDIILSSILKYCRQFSSTNSFVSLVIIQECFDSIEEVSKESCMMVAGIFSVFLEMELHQTVKKISTMLVDYEFMYKLAKNSREVVEGLFDVVYRLSKSYWKKTDQLLACSMLESLFCLNNEVFDESLRRYNHTRYIETEMSKDAAKREEISRKTARIDFKDKLSMYPI